jgi:hypothetical protein
VECGSRFGDAVPWWKNEDGRNRLEGGRHVRTRGENNRMQTLSFTWRWHTLVISSCSMICQFVTESGAPRFVHQTRPASRI